jgi:predicted DNA-binding protein
MPTTSKRKSITTRVGRPPAGERGERVKDYPQVSVRLPQSARDKLVALSKVRRQPQWRLIVESVECYLRGLSRYEQAQIAKLVSSRPHQPRLARRVAGTASQSGLERGSRPGVQITGRAIKRP